MQFPEGRRSVHASLAIDIGGSTWSVGHWSPDGIAVLDEGITGSRPPESLRDLRSAVQRGLASAGPVSAIGVSFPGAVDQSGQVTDWPNRRQWEGHSLAAIIGCDRTRLDIIDDGYAAMLGEARLGIARGLTDALLLSFGTGLGGGFMLRGQMHQAVTGDARTIGHIRALTSQAQCSCGRVGCLQAALNSLPGDECLLAEQFGTWSDGERLVDALTDLARVLGLGVLVLTGGLLMRPQFRRTMSAAFQMQDIRCLVPEHPSRSSLLGAFIASEEAR